MEYNQDVPEYGELMTVEQFRQYVKSGMFIDYDGFGCPVKDGKMADLQISPSTSQLIPSSATHICWFNR